MKIEIHIGQLVLDGVGGVGGGERRAVASALESRLTALLTERGLPASLATAGARSYLDGGSVELPVAATPASTRGAALGTAVAGRIYGALGPARERTGSS